MEFLFNAKDWVDTTWLEKILKQPGKPRPDFSELINEVESSQYQEAMDCGYTFENPLWFIYESDDLDIDINPYWCSGTVSWWITKMIPGQYMPMHSDPFTHDSKVLRYWVPLMDYEVGHIFIYKDKMITDYRLGDVYRFDEAKEIHGAANIGYTPRIMLQISEHL